MRQNKLNGDYKVFEFSPKGKKIAEYETSSDFWLKEGKVFNENGSIKKEFSGHILCDEITYLNDGSKIEKHGGKYNIGNIDEQIATKEISRPNDIRYINKDGKLDRRYSFSQSHGEVSLIINQDDISNEIKIIHPYSKELGKKDVQFAFNVKLNRDVGGSEGPTQSLRIYDDVIVNTKMNTNRAFTGFTKDELLSTITELERGVEVAEQNNMLYIVHQDGCEVSYDRLKNYIQRLKDYANTL